ncbi:unnamed protein product [Spodoptera exigua]|nr:unnamed protein product [Spodoptera exigua]
MGRVPRVSMGGDDCLPSGRIQRNSRLKGIFSVLRRGGSQRVSAGCGGVRGGAAGARGAGSGSERPPSAATARVCPPLAAPHTYVNTFVPRENYIILEIPCAWRQVTTEPSSFMRSLGQLETTLYELVGGP